MPRIFDNIEQQLLPVLQGTLDVSLRADFCVGYFNLRGWKELDRFVERWQGGEGSCCRLLIGMQELPSDQIRETFRLSGADGGIDQQAAIRLKRQMAQEFRDQLTFGAPSNADESGLRRLVAQLRHRKLVVKLFLRHNLHAKLYMCHRVDLNNPIVAFVGSSNLTIAGLAKQGELNVDVLEQDATLKLQRWFDERWTDAWCVDISEELAEIVDTSWARTTPVHPYYIYLKMAYHLSQEARAGLSEFQIPREFGDELLDFQKAAVKIGAHHVNKRDGVLLGDVVGLGKTLMASALARIYQEDHSAETLIICPKNLVRMWEDHKERYRLIGRILSLSRARTELATMRRYRLVVIDESQNLRNREGMTYRAVQDYISANDSKCILLSATPYNKTYLDLSNQLRLFIPPDEDLGIRPERKIAELGETEFIRRTQAPLRSLAAFEKSDHSDDWRELMRLYMVRRTRSFIEENYAKGPDETERKYLELSDGTRFHFPKRIPKTVKFRVREDDPTDAYARLYSDEVVGIINGLYLPRYGLGNYHRPDPANPPAAAAARQLQGLSRAGKRLMGFSRTSMFKRLESGGPSFLLSVRRHILRNMIVIHATQNGLDIPLGPQTPELLDPGVSDEDSELSVLSEDDDVNREERLPFAADEEVLSTEADYARRAASVYEVYRKTHGQRFRWLAPQYFSKTLEEHLLADARKLIEIANRASQWDPKSDEKLKALHGLVTRRHSKDKVIIFTQFADTARYLARQLTQMGVKSVEAVTGDSDDPTMAAWRFSPISNQKREQIPPENEIRVLVATDVLSEGQNLQDAFVVVNFDLPWALVRLVQRAGRVDRLGQRSPDIYCYSFLPADGVERILRLRARVRQRLRENAEVVGADEAFFEDDGVRGRIWDLYHEKAGTLDDETDGEVDLGSRAYEIWKKAIEGDPTLAKTIPEMPNVVYSTREHAPTDSEPAGALVYVRTSADNDALTWVDRDGKSVTQSQLAILRAAECLPDTPAAPRLPEHHELVRRAAAQIALDEPAGVGGQLGRPSGARFRAYERLTRYANRVKGTLFETKDLHAAIDDIYRYPLRQTAIDILNRQIRTGIADDQLASVVISLREEDRLSVMQEDQQSREPQIICSMGLRPRS